MSGPADPRPVLAEGLWEGRVLAAPAGAGGFGYDPVFQVAGSGRSAAELSAEEKNRSSHRGQALRVLLQRLQARLDAYGPAGGGC